MKFVSIKVHMFGESDYLFNTSHIIAVIKAEDGTANIKITTGEIYNTYEDFEALKARLKTAGMYV